MQARVVALRENSARRFWVTMILLLMSINLGIAAYAIVITVSDKSIRPMPDYNNQAVSWQERHELLQKSESLGWSYRLDATASGVAITMLDQFSQPILGCTGTIKAYHYTTAGSVQKAELHSDADHTYRCSMIFDRPGLWKVMLDLTGANGEHFITDETWTLDSGGRLTREKATR